MTEPAPVPRPTVKFWAGRGVLLVAAVALLVLAIVYPYLPGDHDPLAGGLSTLVQAMGIAGLLLVPLGTAWLIADVIRAVRGAGRLRGRAWSIIAIVAASVVVLFISLVAGASGAGIGAVLLVAGWVIAAATWMQRMRRRQSPAATSAPLWMVVIPLVALVAQLSLTEPMTDAARSHAMSTAGEIIADIEAYRLANGAYPVSLTAVYPDYPLGVVGIGSYRYAASGESYNLSFETPRFLLDDPGSRELVVYNPDDEHVMISHASWILLLSPAELLRSQGWYATQDAGADHWRSFLFD